MKSDDARTRSSQLSGKPRRIRAVVLALAIPACMAIFLWLVELRPLATRPSEALSVPVSAAATEYQNPAGYVGPDQCAQCHAERVHEFRGSRHYLACVAATDATMPDVFLTGTAHYTPHNSDVSFDMRKKADQFIQVAMQQTKAGLIQTETPISLMYGYGADTDEVYFSWKNDKLSELPMSWLHPHQEWGTGGFDRMGAGDFSRPTNPRCVECHNTWLEHIPGTPDEYRPQSLIAGVTCEVCHGPAHEHVQYHKEHPDDGTPAHIVQPLQLSRSLQMDLCANCHSNALKHRGPAFSYRPGQPLADFYQTLVTLNPEDDHVANQTTYLLQSKCYQNSETLTCITCHDPHVARNTTQRGAGHSACLSCHQQDACEEQPRIPEAVRDNCVGCHMPQKSKVQVNFDTAEDPLLSPVPRWEHRIAVDLLARDEVLLKWHQSLPGEDHTAEVARLKSSLAETKEHEGDMLTQKFRFLAATDEYRQSLALIPTDQRKKKFEQSSATHLGIVASFTRAEHDLGSNRIHEGIETLEQLLTIKPDHAKAHGRLGTLYAMRNENAKAIEQWRQVAALDPNDAYGEGMIGWFHYLQNQPQPAIEALLRAEEIEPYSFRVNYNLALAYTKLNQYPEAIQRFQLANRIEPQNVECALIVIDEHRKHGQFPDAVQVAEEISGRTFRKNPVVEITRADAQTDAGQFAAAIETLETMERQFVGSDPRLMSEVRQRLQKLAIHRSNSGN